MSLATRTRHLLGAIAIATTLAATATAAPTTQDQSGWYEDALVRFHEGDYRGALIQLKNVLQENPTNLSARILLGRTYLLLGSPTDAEKELQTAIRMGADDELTIGNLAQALLQQHRYKEVLAKILPGNRSARIEAAVMGARATAYYELYRYDDAKQDFQTAHELTPRDPVPLLGIARVLVRQSAYDEAARYVDQAAALAPEHPDVWYVRGEIYKIRNERSAAIQSFSRAIDLVPNHFPARIARATVLMQENRSAEALEDLRHVRKFDRLDAQAAYFMALALAREGDVRGARDALGEADLIIRNTEPGFVRSHAPTMLVAGMVSYARGRHDEAQLYLSDYVKLVPNHVGALRLLSSILLKKQDTKNAVELLERMLRLEPDNWRAHALMGAAKMQLGQVSEATEFLERAAKLNPDGTTVRTRLAMSKLISGDSATAIEELQAALQKDPKAERPAALLGFMHLRRGEYAEAEEVANQLLIENPNNPLAYNLLGGTQMARGDRDGARASFRRALDVVPDYQPALSNLARLELSEGRIEQAKQIYIDTLKRNVNNAKAMRALAEIAEQQNDLNLAIQWYEKAIAANRDDVGPQIRLIELYERKGQKDRVQYLTHELKQAHSSDIRVLEAVGQLELRNGAKDKAVKTFQRMANMRPDSANDLSHIAKLQLAADDTEGAYNTLRRAVWVDPDHRQAVADLIRLESRTRRSSEALQRAEAIRTSRPESDLGDQLLGEVLVNLGRHEEAIEAFRAALGKSETAENVLRLHLAQRKALRMPEALATLQAHQERFGNDPRFARALAAAYIDTGDLAVAIREHERLLDAAPRDAGLLNNLAWLYEETGDERALATAERAYRLSPRAPEVMDTLGWILVQRGDAARGLTLLREAHARSSVDPGIRYHLAVALARLGRKAEAVAQLREVMRSENDAIKTRARSLMDELGS